MGSRIRLDAKQIFECFLEVAKPNSEDDSAFILQSYPLNYKDREQDKLAAVPKFTFPCQLEVHNVQHFSFVLTDVESSWTFGFCRIAPNAQTALVFLSKFPWHEAFYKILNHAAELITYHSQDELFSFLHASHIAKVPESGQMFHVSWLTDKNVMSDFTVETPHHLNLPSLPENRNMNEYYNAVKCNEMITIFASLLHERRIVVTSTKLSKLTACVQAVNTLLYPMSWQHIFIPLLPKNMKDYLTAPMPFLIGVPAPILKRVRKDELGDAVIIDADSGSVFSPYNDIISLPFEVKETLQKGLKSKNLLGDAVARAHLSAIVHLIGGYRDALRLRQGPGEKITFNEDAFLNSRPPHMTSFLRQMLELQLFRQFIEERLTLLNSGNSVSDEFETEVLRYAERSPHSVKFKSQMSELKREGGALVKAVKTKANPAMKNAVRSVKEGSKKMSFKVQTFGNEVMKKNGTQLRPSFSTEDEETQSAPSSPTSTRRSSEFNNLTGGLIRNTTDLNIKARVLKYEKFEPPPLSSLSSTNLSKSPEFERPADLGMDLMADMHDVINRKISPYHMQPPKVNRQLKPPLRRTSNNNVEPAAVIDKELPSKNPVARATLGESPELDLIALGGTEPDETDEIIFDPLFSKGQSLPRPPNTSSTHRPLQRTSVQPPSNSSEDLLREYGLDFATLSMNQNRSNQVVNNFPNPPSNIPMNIFDDLDPLAPTQNPPSIPPVAPPRTRRQVSNNWTTFD